MKYSEIFEKSKLEWNKDLEIGWWLDKDPVRFYHGTHKNNLRNILDNGINSPKEGSTKGWVSLALDPKTARGYASMYGGETNFRDVNKKPKHVPLEDRVVIVLEIPQNYFLSRMAEARGNMDNERDKLTNEQKYIKFKENNGSDFEYYALTEIRLPDRVPSKFIVGYY